jgi:hypothetical protein
MRVAATCAFGMALGGSQLASAATTFVPYATAGAEYDSNVFAGVGAPQGEELFHIIGGMAADYQSGQNDVGVNAAITRLIYDHLVGLDNTEYNLGGHLTWHFGPVISTDINYTYNHFMAPFAQTLTTQLEMDTDQLGSVALHVAMTPEWRLDLTPMIHEADLPLPGYQEFHLQEKVGTAALNYLGLGRTTVFVSGTYTDGDYTGIPDATKYQGTDMALGAVYKVTGLSDFNGQVGYTVRDTQLNPAGNVPVVGGAAPLGAAAGLAGTTEAVTYRLYYDRQLTAKTGFSVGAYRAINSYVAGANAEVGTGGELDLRWLPDAKFNVAMVFKVEQDTFVGNVVVQQNFPNRADLQGTTNFQVTYSALAWLSARAYVTYTDRTSNFAQANYVGWILGLELTGKLQ